MTAVIQPAGMGRTPRPLLRDVRAMRCYPPLGQVVEDLPSDVLARSKLIWNPACGWGLLEFLIEFALPESVIMPAM